ncbi:pirin-like protein [Neltuma alba]|uniref:pirin-like protein n=1 Tax=Neltuma alba TaxID=207710 RepID=UPI0010A48C87|nr:pirin-like protein [Prosopis alba]
MLLESPRLVAKKVLAKSLLESNGALLRGFGRELDCLDPFVMLIHFSVTPPGGFPDHPHRGFETVTYMLQGAINYQDFGGHKGTLRTGDLQWVRAGRGIVHSEMPAEEGTHTGLQLWINLSSKHKMIEPRCREVVSKEIPSVERDGAEIRVLAGEALGVKAPVWSKTPIMMLDVTVKPASQVHLRTPESWWNYFVYVIEGEAVVGCETSEAIAAEEVAVLGGGDGVRVWNKSGEKRMRLVVVGGEAVKEKVAQRGPFVMSTESEIEEAMEDFRLFRNGFEMAKSWKSNP